MSQVRPMIRNLAGYVTQLAQETNQHLNNLTRKQNTTDDVVAVLVRICGEEEVQAGLKALQEERQKAREAAQDAATKRLVDGGGLKPIEEVTATCLLVGTDSFKDGSSRRVHFEMEALDPEAAAKFIGKKVGETVVNEEVGVTFTVNEIYSIDKAKVEEIISPKPPVEVASGADNAPTNEDGSQDSPPGGKKAKKQRKAKA